MEYKDKKLKKAVEELRKLCANEEVMLAYEKEEKIERDRISERKYIEKEAKREAKKETAIKFYENGGSKDLIARSLNISIEELDKILKLK